jgi:hypothetical protein
MTTTAHLSTDRGRRPEMRAALAALALAAGVQLVENACGCPIDGGLLPRFPAARWRLRPRGALAVSRVVCARATTGLPRGEPTLRPQPDQSILRRTSSKRRIGRPLRSPALSAHPLISSVLVT